jgi:hypothetical protein
LPGSHNDLNVLFRSPLFSRLVGGEAPPCNYVVNGRDLLIASTQYGPYLWRQSNVLKAPRYFTLQQCKNQQGRMWREPLVCFKIGLQLFMAPQSTGNRRLFGK